jgi:hypothetical protein
MENINDPRSIIGMAEILANDDEDLDFEDLEKSIINGMEFKKKDMPTHDKLEQEYEQEADSLFKQFNLSNDDVYDTDKTSRSKPSAPPLDWGPYSQPNKPSSKPSSNDSDSDSSSESDTDSDTGEGDKNMFSSNAESWSPSKPTDPHLSQMTNEERRQHHINKVLGKMEKNDDDSTFVQQEEEEDEMARIMEQIDLLRTNLESEGVDLSRIPEVHTHTNRKDARAILRMLQIKNDRLRYCDMFEEGILAMAYALEGAFDGKKEYFGTKIDLVGWPDTVKVKLRRMRYNTSSFVGDIMKGYNIGHGWRILLELLPSLFLYSRDRRIKTGDNLMSDDKYKDALRELQQR